MTRTLAVWCPDWPVTAAGRSAGCPPDAPIAVLDRGQVLACSAAARHEGVRRGLRTRDAQARCPELVVLPYDPALDAHAFDPVVAALEELTPGVQIMRPGACAIRARGPSRYYGGEAAAGAAIADCLARLDITDSRIGIAEGPFAAEQAARAAIRRGDRIHVVPTDASGRFLAPLPVEALGQPDLASLLRRLGLRTLGSFADLSPTDVLARFGPEGAFAHRLARGRDGRPVVARQPPPELSCFTPLEPPVDRVDQVAFAVRECADRFVADLADHKLVCTTVRIEVHTESGDILERSWLHPRWFDAADLVDRVRWQLQGVGPSAGELDSPVIGVRLSPDEADPIGAHAEGLWGGGPDERIHRALTRVQSMLGHEAVAVAVPSGGRGPADRQTLVPWGERARPGRPVEQPWPGNIPAPLPSTMYAPPLPALVVAADGHPVGVSTRGTLTGELARFCPDGRSVDQLRPVAAWAGPWPVEERWWDTEASRRLARFQIVSVDGSAWLLAVENRQWWTEASYD
ncbi:MAG TPA: DNA polymerase Y family protein [Nocardioidaceae bacterium]|nr:DNA polymerase Y family protein [Nocardioidaceae bacterium]